MHLIVNKLSKRVDKIMKKEIGIEKQSGIKKINFPYSANRTSRKVYKSKLTR